MPFVRASTRLLGGVLTLAGVSLVSVQALQTKSGGRTQTKAPAQTSVPAPKRAPRPAAWPPPVHRTPEKAPVLTAEQELETIVVPPGYQGQLVASEPLVKDP